MLIVGWRPQIQRFEQRFLRTSRANLCFTTFITSDGSPVSGSLINQ
jgi:hypothetical protein